MPGAPGAPATTNRPAWWPHFSSTLRSTALTARLGRVLGIGIGICFVTGLLSYYQYLPWSWLPNAAWPVWGYRFTQGVHVATGTALIPLLLIKLWSVYPNLFRWPPVRSVKHALERLSVFLLISSALLQVSTGFVNTLGWYPWPWDFATVHLYLASVVVGSVLLHIGLKLPDIVYGLQTKPVAKGDVLTEIPWYDNPESHSNAGPLPPPVTPGISRRGVLAATGAGLGVVLITTVGQTIKPLQPVGLLATRQPQLGPQGVPVNRTAEEAQVIAAAMRPNWRLEVLGSRPYTLNLGDLEGLAQHEGRFPISCVEGWSAGADWRGLSLLEVIERAGGNPESRIRLVSLERGAFSSSTVFGPQLPVALLATHINGERLSVDHGFPLRLIAPNRAGVLNTKWLARIEVS